MKSLQAVKSRIRSLLSTREMKQLLVGILLATSIIGAVNPIVGPALFQAGFNGSLIGWAAAAFGAGGFLGNLILVFIKKARILWMVSILLLLVMVGYGTVLIGEPSVTVLVMVLIMGTRVLHGFAINVVSIGLVNRYRRAAWKAVNGSYEREEKDIAKKINRRILSDEELLALGVTLVATVIATILFDSSTLVWVGFGSMVIIMTAAAASRVSEDPVGETPTGEEGQQKKGDGGQKTPRPGFFAVTNGGLKGTPSCVSEVINAYAGIYAIIISAANVADAILVVAVATRIGDTIGVWVPAKVPYKYVRRASLLFLAINGGACALLWFSPPIWVVFLVVMTTRVTTKAPVRLLNQVEFVRNIEKDHHRALTVPEVVKELIIFGWLLLVSWLVGVVGLRNIWLIAVAPPLVGIWILLKTKEYHPAFDGEVRPSLRLRLAKFLLVGCLLFTPRTSRWCGKHAIHQ